MLRGLSCLRVLIENSKGKRKDSVFYLCFVQRGRLGPLKQVLIDVPVIAAKHRAQRHILEIKRINQSNGIWANDSQQLLDALVHLGDLRVCQDVLLEEAEQANDTQVRAQLGL